MNVAEYIELACLMEATARKPGNVHPAASFADLHYNDFVQAAAAIAAPLARSPGSTLPSAHATTTSNDNPSLHAGGLGDRIFRAVEATRKVTGSNVNLGIILLLAPLAAVPVGTRLEDGVPEILKRTTRDDAERVYAAIRLAQPGGLGTATKEDVHELPTVTLREAMTLATDRDRIAEQYCTDFQLVFTAREKLFELIGRRNHWESAVVTLHVWIMSQWPDTLIARKCGWDVARQAAAQAEALLAGMTGDSSFDPRQLQAFDQWLRADGHRRNPGTTADLVAATLYAALRDGFLAPPSRSAIFELADGFKTASIETD